MHNTSIHSSTGATPYEVMYSFPARTPGFDPGARNLTQGGVGQTRSAQASSKMWAGMQSLHEAVADKNEEIRQQYERYFNSKARPVQFQVGDRVWLFESANLNVGFGRKMRHPYTGPHLVTKITGKVAELSYNLSRNLRKVNIERLKHVTGRDLDDGIDHAPSVSDSNLSRPTDTDSRGPLLRNLPDNAISDGGADRSAVNDDDELDESNDFALNEEFLHDDLALTDSDHDNNFANFDTDRFSRDLRLLPDECSEQRNRTPDESAPGLAGTPTVLAGIPTSQTSSEQSTVPALPTLPAGSARQAIPGAQTGPHPSVQPKVTDARQRGTLPIRQSEARSLGPVKPSAPTTGHHLRPRPGRGSSSSDPSTPERLKGLMQKILPQSSRDRGSRASKKK